jgi:hypothetical protein
VLEKLNALVYDGERRRVVKQVVTYAGATSERIALAVLGRLAVERGGHALLRVPALYEDACTDYTVCMGHVRGIRLYDLTAILNGIAGASVGGRAEKARQIKSHLIEWSLASLNYFQSRQVQESLRAALGRSLEVYDFAGKLEEAAAYLCLLHGRAPDALLRDDVALLAQYLATDACVTFRDATLKNRVLTLPDEVPPAVDYESQDAAALYRRPSNWQWTDRQTIAALLDTIEDPDSLRNRIVDLDFESAYTLTTRIDDYLHILTLEVTGPDYAACLRDCLDQLAIGEEAYNYALLFRSFREWARRMFYHRERPNIYATRYYYESLRHNFNLAWSAVGQVRLNTRAGHLSGIYALLREWQEEV